MRGTRSATSTRRPETGIIPAYAGNTRQTRGVFPRRRDHPRVCGEHEASFAGRRAVRGSSPRMRGTHCRCNTGGCCGGIIPAYAGNTHVAPTFQSTRRDHPRVCGEHPHVIVVDIGVLGSSPRMRGTLPDFNAPDGITGIIPAYAGNTLRDYSNFVVSKFMSFVFHLV